MLTDLHAWGDEISLIPNSGIQFVDFAFDLAANRKLSRTFIERATSREGGRRHLALLRIPELARATTCRRTTICCRTIWSGRSARRGSGSLPGTLGAGPVPADRGRLHLGSDATFEHGPTNWARVRVVEIPDRLAVTGRATGPSSPSTPRSAELRPDRPYVAPTPENVTSPVFFRLASDLGKVGWFFSDTRSPDERSKSRWFQGWVDQWLMESLRRIRAAQEHARDVQPRGDGVPAGALDALRRLPGDAGGRAHPAAGQVRGYDQPRPDAGAAEDRARRRRPGARHRQQPDLRSAARDDSEGRDVITLDDTLVLQIARSGTRRTRLRRAVLQPGRAVGGALRRARHRAPVDPAQSRSSGRAWCAWGRRRSACAARNDGAGADTGMSSPKRYLWDVDPVSTPWEFQPSDYDRDRLPPAVEVIGAAAAQPRGRPVDDQRRRGAEPRPGGPEPGRAAHLLAVVVLLADADGGGVPGFGMVNSPGVRMHRLQGHCRARSAAWF